MGWGRWKQTSPNMKRGAVHREPKAILVAAGLGWGRGGTRKMSEPSLPSHGFSDGHPASKRKRRAVSTQLHWVDQELGRASSLQFNPLTS